MAVEIRNLCKSFDGLNIYDHFNFTIEEGMVTAIIGPSGCGKTTLLRMLAGLEEPDSGTISRTAETKAEDSSHGADHDPSAETDRTGHWPDKTLRSRSRHWGRTAVVFQEDRLLPWLTVKENMKLVLEGDCAEAETEAGRAEPDAEAGRAECDRWTLEGMIRFMGLSGFEDYYPEALSGGMKRRVAIGRALLYGGDILLMDEPFKGLDDELKRDIMTVLSAEWKRRKSTVVLITHDREDADELADRIWEFGGRPLAAKSVARR